MLICSAISDTDHIPPRRNNQRRPLSGNIVDEAIVEIETGTRRVIDYVLSPIREVASEVARERLWRGQCRPHKQPWRKGSWYTL
jgi:hypothetical protein